MTLQTSKPLPQLRLGHRRYDVESVLNLLRGGHIDLNPPCQRGSVWGMLRRRNLIRSLLLGLPVGQVTINNRGAISTFSAPGYQRHTSPGYAVIDGKQRIETLRDFSLGAFAVPRSWWEPEDLRPGAADDTADGPYVRFEHLTDSGQLRFELAALPTDEARATSPEEEAELFELINFGGVPQGERDKDAA